MSFERGKTYTRKQIHAEVGGGVQDFLPHQGGRIVAGCFDQALNPRAPGVVLAGDGPEIERWARVFGVQDTPVPVFLKERSNAWYCMGEFVCERWSDSRDVIEEHAAGTGRDDVSVVLFLRRVAR